MAYRCSTCMKPYFDKEEALLCCGGDLIWSSDILNNWSTDDSYNN